MTIVTKFPFYKENPPKMGSLNEAEIYFDLKVRITFEGKIFHIPRDLDDAPFMLASVPQVEGQSLH
jgi:hypothetical protein